LKKIIATALLLAAPAFVLAQAPAKADTSKAETSKAAASTPKKKKAPESASRVDARSTASQMASGIMAAEAALSPEDIKLAERVYTGKLPCELGAFVDVEADPKSPGYFDVQIVKGPKFRMFPVLSRTGAIRLEDQRTGAIWLQLANKSMLMDQRAGKRLADECMSPDQSMVAEALKKNPIPSFLDAPTPARAASAAASTASAASAAAATASQPSVVVQPTGLPSAPDTAAVVPLTSASAAPAPLKPASAP
jgi:hypothetical protein